MVQLSSLIHAPDLVEEHILPHTTQDSCNKPKPSTQHSPARGQCTSKTRGQIDRQKIEIEAYTEPKYHGTCGKIFLSSQINCKVLLKQRSVALHRQGRFQSFQMPLWLRLLLWQDLTPLWSNYHGKIIIFIPHLWDFRFLQWCKLVYRQQRFGGSWCLHLHGRFHYTEYGNNKIFWNTVNYLPTQMLYSCFTFIKTGE